MVGCATDPTPSALLVSSTSNTFVPPATVEIVATNRSDRPLFLKPCLGEQRRSAGGSWQGIPDGACTAVDALALVKPGATDSIPMPWLSTPGTYRIAVSYTTDSSFSASAKQSLSNSFDVVK